MSTHINTRLSSASTMLVCAVILLALTALGSSTPTTPVYDTIIVGMGAAGCTAASVLCEAGKKVLALEAMNRVGGRVNTVPFGNGIAEVGAEWIHGAKTSRVYELAMRHNISIRVQTLDNFRVFRSDGLDTNKEVLLELVNYGLGTSTNAPKEPEAVGPYVTGKLTEYISSKYPALLEDKDFIHHLLHITEMTINGNVAAYSWNDICTYSQYEDLEGDLYLSWHEHGYKTFFELLLKTYQGGPGLPNLDLQLEKEVTKISYPKDPAQDVEVRCKDGSVYKARNVIVTVSLGVLKESHKTLFAPELPTSKTSAIDHISMGLIGKIILLFPNPWWGNSSSDDIMFFWTKEDVQALDKDLIDIGGATAPLGNRNALTIWTYGNTTRLMETLPEDVVKRKAMELLRRFMGNVTTIPDPIEMLRTTWYSNPYTRGTYTFDNIQTPLHPNDRANLAEPLVDSSGTPRVLFAGEATNTIHYGTVHGAAETGYREATRLVSVN